LIALDTNILVYAASAQDVSSRHVAALELLGRLGATGAIIALPVIGELFNVRRKKKFADVVMLLTAVEIWSEAFDTSVPQLEDYLRASVLSEQNDLQFFDALIIAVSARAGATMLLSEDMHDRLEVEGLRIVNPFESANDALLADYFAATR
jgi:predicted nucleic acid-binding protein